MMSFFYDLGLILTPQTLHYLPSSDSLKVTSNLNIINPESSQTTLSPQNSETWCQLRDYLFFQSVVRRKLRMITCRFTALYNKGSLTDFLSSKTFYVQFLPFLKMSKDRHQTLELCNKIVLPIMTQHYS